MTPPKMKVVRIKIKPPLGTSLPSKALTLKGGLTTTAQLFYIRRGQLRSMKPAAKVGQCRAGATGQSGQASLAENSPGAGSKPDSRGLGILSEGSIATPRDRSVCIVFGPDNVSL